ncbi:putative harbinger transposase-derived protein [Tanacetum coccineum]
MILKDVELDAHKIYEGDSSKFLDLTVFNEVMCKNPKLKLNIDRDKTRLLDPNEESGGSTKRSRTSEEGDYVVLYNQETPTSGGLTIQRPIGRDATKKKGKVFITNMSSDSESLSSDPDSSLISSNSIEYHEWESHVVQYNQHIDRILENVIINYLNLIIQEQRTRARRVYRDRERVQGAMWVLACRTSFDVVDEYLRISGVVTRKSLMSFVQGVISCFGDEYLRMPNEDDLPRLLYVREQHGFPCMIGRIDCMHWQWKNCPTSWSGKNTGRCGKPTIILEAIASYDLLIWHPFF